MKKNLLILLALAILTALPANAQVDIYRSSGGEIIFSSADVRTTLGPASINPGDLDPNPYKVNTNVRFTLFLHIQQFLNIDLTSKIGLLTGVTLRNVGLITEDLYQHVGFNHIDNTHQHWNKNTKFKRRSYSLGFPLALKLGDLPNHSFIYAGGEYEWMFHYKQKLFIDGNKSKYTEWGSERVTPWVPSFFVGVQFPQGMNLKFKYYLDNFLNQDFRGVDFGEQVDYSQFESSSIWYISLSFVLNRKQVEKMMNSQGFDTSASL